MKIATIFRGNLRDEDRSIEKFELVINSIYKLFNTENIDFYMHLWGLEEEQIIYENSVKFKKIIIEKNQTYHNEIYEISKKHGLEGFNQISSSLSIKKACELFYENNCENNYDAIFITRPDLPFSEKLLDFEISDDVIYINEHGPYIESGDYCFLFSQNNLKLFNNMFNYLEMTNNRPTIHKWIYEYLKNYCNKNIKLSNISVGVNCEIFKHLENFPYPKIETNIFNFVNMILITYGTRPEYIKVKPLMDEMAKQGLKFKTLFTGQHKDIVSSNPDFTLDMKDYGDNRLDNIIQNCMNLPDNWFYGITHILVQGDTTSVTGLALSALHRKIPVIHLEAGLRTFDTENPYPEENNRKIVSTIAKIHLCPTELNKENLKNENVQGEIYVVGNTVLDNLLEYKTDCEYTNKILITLHRRENHINIDQWFNSINQLAKTHTDLEFIIPLHPNPNVQKFKHLLTNVKIIEPLSHTELIKLLVKSKLVITDSGGLQEECSFFNKKCLVCRKITERPETLGMSSFLIQTPDDLINTFNHHLINYQININSPYGDGYSSSKICEIFKNL